MTRSIGKVCVLLLGAALSVGCPVGDPYTVSQIRNETGETIEIELVLDKGRLSKGFEPEEFEKWLSELSDEWIREELQRFTADGEGVEMVSMDTARLAGSYELASAGLMIVHASLGKGPHFGFSELTVTTKNKTLTFEEKQEIRELFERVEGNLWELRITDAF